MDGIFYFGFLIGIIIIIVGCCVKSQKKIDKEAQEIAKYADVEFDITKNIGDHLYLDENRNKICIPSGIFKKKVGLARVYNYIDILNYELLEDGNSVSKGGVGRALVGGVLFGGVGAIVGSSTGHKQKQTCTRLKIKITLNNIEHPTEYINFISSETKKDDIIYKNAYSSAQEVLSTLDIICNSRTKDVNEKNVIVGTGKSIPDQIKELKEIFDSGVINESEFNEAKNKIINGK